MGSHMRPLPLSISLSQIDRISSHHVNHAHPIAPRLHLDPVLFGRAHTDDLFSSHVAVGMHHVYLYGAHDEHDLWAE